MGMSGESDGIFFPKSTITDPNANGYGAAVIAGSFGQTFKVTPIQLVRAISAVVNGGYVMQPYIVSEVLDGDGNVVQKNEPTVIRQAISEETSTLPTWNMPFSRPLGTPTRRMRLTICQSRR